MQEGREGGREGRQMERWVERGQVEQVITEWKSTSWLRGGYDPRWSLSNEWGRGANWGSDGKGGKRKR